MLSSCVNLDLYTHFISFVLFTIFVKKNSSSCSQMIGFADIHVRQPEGDILIFMTGQVSIFVI